MEAKFYDGPGQGRKQCKCGKYIGSGSAECPGCGHIFRERVTPPATIAPSPPKIYDEPGIGRKQCVCGKYIAGRLSVCPACGSNEFHVKPAKVVLAFDEPGPGRSQCVCGKYYASRTSACPACGSQEVRQRVVTYDEPGVHRKKCPDCSKYVNNKATACACGHDFGEYIPPRKSKSGEVELPSRLIAIHVIEHLPRPMCRVRALSTPAGACPVKLKGIDQDSVHEWVESLVEVCYGRGHQLTVESVKYYARHFHDYNSKEYREVVAWIDREPVAIGKAAETSEDGDEMVDVEIIDDEE